MYKKLKIFILVSIPIIFLNAQRVTFSEVMWNPSTNEYYDEYIEIVNTGDVSFSLRHSGLEENVHLNINGERENIISPDSTYILKSGERAVILDNGYLIEGESNTYDEMIPDSVLLLTIEGASFGLDNDSPNELKLITPLRDTLSQYTTTPDQEEGYSDEKIILSGANSETNWGNSKNKMGTPGLKNSITPLEKDLAISSLELTSKGNQVSEKKINIELKVKNIGRKFVDEAQVVCGRDGNQDGKLQDVELALSENISLDKNDSLIKTVTIDECKPGINLILGKVSYPEDMDKTNNAIKKEIYLPYSKGSIAINEIMYYPEGSFEWIELLNTTDSQINLRNWEIGDANKNIKIEQKSRLRAGEYVTVVSDSSFLSAWPDRSIIALKNSLPALNNTYDSIKIIDPADNIIDSTKYDNSWGYEPGISLERRNPYVNSSLKSNWGLSNNSKGATPSNKNSILVKDRDLSLPLKSVQIFPQTYCRGDTVNIVFKVKNIGLDKINSFKVRGKYHQNADSVSSSKPIFKRDFNKSLNSQESILDTIKWEVSKGGIGFLQLEVINKDDQNNENNNIAKQIKAGFQSGTLLINEIMYNPQSGNSEWFEIINNSTRKINLAGWMFKDSQNSLNTITENINYIPKDSFIVVSENRSILNQYADISEKQVVIPETFSILNNDRDSLILIGPDGNNIDGLQYKSSWGKDKGRSLERRSAKKSSNLANNWSLAKSDQKASPGRINTIAMRNYDLKIDSVWITPKSIIEDDSGKVNIAIKNGGLKTISDYSVLINIFPEDSSRGSILQDELEVSKNIESEEVHERSIRFEDIPGGVYSYTVHVISDRDQNVKNNFYSDSIRIGYKEGSVVINEIMYSPARGEAEWIELYNTTNRVINMEGWELTDAIKKWETITDSTMKIEGQDYYILAASNEFMQSYPSFEGECKIISDFPTLNNTSDKLILRDAADHKIEEVNYNSNWGGAENRSIERRNPYSDEMAKNNWGTSQDSLGATPARDNSILKYDYDLSIVGKEVGFKKKQVKSGQLVRFNLQVKNKGIEKSTKFNITLYRDENKDSSGNNFEEVWKLRNIPPLKSDSLRNIQGKIFSSNPGHNTYICKLEAEKDYTPYNNKIYDFLEVSYPNRALVINEFLAAPSDQQVEYIELYNQTEGRINLKNWKFNNSWKSWSITGDYRVPAGDYYILTSDSMIFNYYSLEQENIIVSDEFPGLNNNSDSLKLLDLTNKEIDMVHYDENWGVEEGKSFERSLPEEPSENPSSWEIATAEQGGTPGAFNSISPLEYDLGLDTLIYTNQGDTSDVFSLFFYCSNAGRKTAKNASIQIINGAGEVVKERTIPEMESGVQKEVPVEVGPFPRGTHFYRGEIEWNKDLNSENNSDIFKIYVSFLKGELIVSEFMPIPHDIRKKGQSTAEYIEIYNFTHQDVNLSDWSITDANTADNYNIPNGAVIEGKEFLALAEDSSIVNYKTINQSNYSVLPKFPDLNNDKDMIVLKDPRGKIIDSLSYSSNWNLKEGFAKEKLYLDKPNLSNNWRSSTADGGGTPGYQNSVKVENLAKKPGLRAEPQAFSPNGDGEKDKIGFYYRLSYNTANITVTVYDLKGRMIAQPADNKYTSKQGVVHWNGDSKQGGKARVGRYIARIKAVDSETKDKEGYITTFVVSKRSQ